MFDFWFVIFFKMVKIMIRKQTGFFSNMNTLFLFRITQ